MSIPQPAADNDYLGEHAELLLGSFHHWTGRHLVDPMLTGRARYRALYRAEFGLVSHNTDTDPVFNYANATAQELFELDWDSFVRLPSRESAEQVDREERERIMARVTRHGFIDNYSGVRVSASGRRFRIEHTTIWNLIDTTGDYRGQAAVFTGWTLL